MKKTEWKKKKIKVQVGNGIQTSKPWIFISKTIYPMNWREFKNKDTNVVFYWSPPFSIQTHEQNIKKKKINVLFGNGFQTWKPWISISKTIYAMNSRKFKHEDTNAVFYGTPPFSIQTHEKNLKEQVN